MRCFSNMEVPVPNNQLKTWSCTQTPLLIMILGWREWSYPVSIYDTDVETVIQVQS